MAVHLVTDFWKGCWELVCGHAFRLVSVFVCKWLFEFVVFLCDLDAGQGNKSGSMMLERGAMLLCALC